MQTQRRKPVLWKSVIIATVALLAIAGLFVVLFNLPIITGYVPQ